MNDHVSEEALLKSIVDAKQTPSEDIARSIMLSAGMSPDDLAKNLVPTINTASGLVAFDLQAPAKNLYPVYTPIRNVLPRVGGGTGLATNWRQVNSIAGSGWDAMGWVPEGQRAAAMSISTSNKAASYVTIGEEALATFEAISAGKTFEDVQAKMTMRLLQKTMLKEELGLLFGNNSLALGTPATASLSFTAGSATLPSATYSVIVVALSGEGYANSSLAGGVATTKSITGLDGQTYSLSGGSSMKSASATQAITLGQTLNATVASIQGAVAYAWFVGTAGAETLQAITTINSATFAAPLAGSRQAATAVTADNSTNSLAYNGLFTSAAVGGSGAYVNYLATGTAGTGTALTASGRGSVNEIDVMMKTMWDTFQLSVDVLYVNSQELKNITTKVLTGATGGSLINYFQDPSKGEYILTAGGAVEFYYNPFMAPGAGRRIPIRIHPNVPPGTIVGWASQLPIQYQSNEVPNIAEVKTRNDYYQINWPLTSRNRQVGVYSEQVLAIYAPFGMGVISNITNG
jgi:hypothetical protein